MGQLYGELVIAVDERITEQKTFVGKNYNVLWAKLGEMRNWKWNKESQSSETSQYLMPPFTKTLK